MRLSSQGWRIIAIVLSAIVPVAYLKLLGLSTVERQFSFAVLLYFLGYLVIGLGRDRKNSPLPHGRVIAIVPAYNEDPERLHSAIRSLLTGTFVPDVIHVVDDGSAVPLPPYRHPKVVWHRQENKGKHNAQATALYAELRHRTFDFVVTVDSDSIVDRYAIERCLRKLSDPKVNAVTGAVRALNRRKSLITRVTDLHYMHSCLVVRDGLSRMGDVFTTSGALAVYRSDMWLSNLEEYLKLGVADDRHLTHIAQRTGRTVAASDAYVDTFVPDNVPDLMRQRIRWSRDYYRCIIMDVKYLRGWSFWMRAIDCVLMTVAPLLAVTAFMVFPSAQWRVPWIGMALWVVFLYIQTSCYLLSRQNVTFLSRFTTWLFLSPVLYLFQILIIGPAMVVSLLNVRHPSWQTRNAKTKPASVSKQARGTGIQKDGRDPWFDFIRMIAIIRIVFFHATGYAWLGLVFPSMGIMFGLGGSLMAKSLIKVGDRPEIMLWRRLCRLIPSVWALAVVLIPVMLYVGWTSEDARPFNEAAIVAWILPISDPPGNDWAAPITGTIWYIRTYIWLMLLSVPMFAAFKRYPRLATVAPIIFIFLGASGYFNLWLTDVMLKVGTYGTCWLIGFAHRMGHLNKISASTTVSLAGVMLGVGFAYLKLGDTNITMIQDIPSAQMLWCTGFVLLFLRFRPPMDWLSKPLFYGLNWLVTKMSARAVTIYLWHQVAVVLSMPILTWMGVWTINNHALWMVAKFTVIIVLVIVACIVWGPVEDLGSGARRKAVGETATESKLPSHRKEYMPDRWLPELAPAGVNTRNGNRNLGGVYISGSYHS